MAHVLVFCLIFHHIRSWILRCMITFLTHHLSGETIQIPLADGSVMQWFSDPDFKHVRNLELEVSWVLYLLVTQEAGWCFTNLIALFFSGSRFQNGQSFWGDLAVGAELPLSSWPLPCRKLQAGTGPSQVGGPAGQNPAFSSGDSQFSV